MIGLSVSFSGPAAAILNFEETTKSQAPWTSPCTLDICSGSSSSKDMISKSTSFVTCLKMSAARASISKKQTVRKVFQRLNFLKMSAATAPFSRATPENQSANTIFLEGEARRGARVRRPVAGGARGAGAGGPGPVVVRPRSWR